MPSHPAPNALLLIAPGCPHCPQVLAALTERVKSGALGRLEVVNIAVHPERAQELGARAAPWLRIGGFVLVGAQTPAEIDRWLERAAGGEGFAEYLRELLAGGRLGEAEERLAVEPRQLAAVLELIADPQAPMQVRLGAGALLEGFAGTDALRALVEPLAELSRHADHRVRADACHYLGLSGDAAARAPLEARLDDPSGEVREIAAEALESL